MLVRYHSCTKNIPNYLNSYITKNGIPGSINSGSPGGAAEAGRAGLATPSSRIESGADGGEAGDANADHARPPPRPRASERQPGFCKFK